MTTGVAAASGDEVAELAATLREDLGGKPPAKRKAAAPKKRARPQKKERVKKVDRNAIFREQGGVCFVTGAKLDPLEYGSDRPDGWTVYDGKLLSMPANAARGRLDFEGLRKKIFIDLAVARALVNTFGALEEGPGPGETVAGIVFAGEAEKP